MLSMAAVLLAGYCFFRSLNSWRVGVLVLFGMLPYMGVFTIIFKDSSFAPLIKDFVIVMPLYISFVLSLIFKSREFSNYYDIPVSITYFIACIIVLVVVQTLNPGVESFLMKAIGLKVWLFYLPFIYIGNHFIRSKNDLVLVLRVIAVSSIIPMCIGICEFLLSLLFGYKEVMYSIYGDAASAATQNFQTYELGFTLMRIPSTFSYWIQYSAYTFSMVVFSYMLVKLDEGQNWKKFARILFWVSLIAALLSGAKANFLYLSMLLMALLLFEKKSKLLTAMFFGTVVFGVVFTSVLGLDLSVAYELYSRLLLRYWGEVVVGGILEGFTIFGLGTGVNTGPARIAIENYDYSLDAMIENYYAKALIELGIIGLVLILLLFRKIAVAGFQQVGQLTSGPLKSASAAILAYTLIIIATSVKGWLLDLDPINIYFWFFVGVLFALARCELRSV